MIIKMIIEVSFRNQKLQLSMINVIYYFVKQRTADTYNMKNLTNIKIQIRDCYNKTDSVSKYDDSVEHSS